MDTNNTTLDFLKKYLHSKCGVEAKDIDRNTSLFHDLEFKGDDIDEFLSDLIENFNIDIKRLNLSRFCIGDEPFDFLSPLIRFFKIEKINEKPTLLIADIEKFILTGILE
jgi:hypothetical protein